MGQLERSRILQGGKAEGLRNPSPQAPPQCVFPPFNQVLRGRLTFSATVVEGLISIWKTFRIIGTSRLFELCNDFNRALSDVCFWTGLCCEKPAKRSLLQVSLMKKTSELTCSPWKCWAFFTRRPLRGSLLNNFGFVIILWLLSLRLIGRCFYVHFKGILWAWEQNELIAVEETPSFPFAKWAGI